MLRVVALLDPYMEYFDGYIELVEDGSPLFQLYLLCHPRFHKLCTSLLNPGCSGIWVNTLKGLANEAAMGEQPGKQNLEQHILLAKAIEHLLKVDIFARFTHRPNLSMLMLHSSLIHKEYHVQSSLVHMDPDAPCEQGI